MGGRRAGRGVRRGHQRQRQRRRDDGGPLDDGQGRRVHRGGPGDRVWIRDGTYNGAVNFTRSGNSGAWIAVRNFTSSGFGNGRVNDTGTSNGYILDQMSDGATFANNIGFHNGGSWRRATGFIAALMFAPILLRRRRRG